MPKMNRYPLDVGGLMCPTTSIPTSQMAMKKTLDEDNLVLDG